MKNTATRHNKVLSRFQRKERQTPTSPHAGSRKNCAIAILAVLLIILAAFFDTTQNKSLAQDKLTEQTIESGDIKLTLVFSTEIDVSEQNVLVDAAKYWLSIMKPTTSGEVRFAVVKSNDLEKNAAAVSLIDNDKGEFKVTGVQSIIANGSYVDEVVPDGDVYRYRTPKEIEDGVRGAHAQIMIGTGWATTTEKSQSGAIDNNLLPVLIHEMGHVFGMTTSLKENKVNEDGEVLSWRFDNKLTLWDSFLRDNNGNKSRANQTIGHSNIQKNTLFELGNMLSSSNPSSATFYASNALNVYYDNNQTLINAAGKTGGVPVTGYVITLDEDDNETWGIDSGGTLSHLDTWYSLLSWHDFRNFQGLIEVEMAVFKDLGYSNIETRDFFGQSFYVSGKGEHGLTSTQQIAQSGFGKWSDGAYDTSVTNDSMFGIGVHLFGNKLNILQKGIINSSGDGGAGIRVDGVGNFLTTDTDSDILMSQDNGIGLLVAFGKEHVVVHRGSISAYALGYGEASSFASINGIAASFDFGAQLFASEDDVATGGVSSYLRSYYVDPESGKKLAATDGPLVRRFDVTGKLFGSRASIHIGKTAHVDQINIMKGAQIDGNILSFYKSGSRGTTLTFGLSPNENGQATATSDSNFRFVLSDHINYDTADDDYDESNIVSTDGVFDIGIYGGVVNFNNILVSSRIFDIGADATLLLGSATTLPTPESLPYTRISTTNIVYNKGVLAGTGEVRIGTWDIEAYKESGGVNNNLNNNADAGNTDENDETNANANATSNWSDRKIDFWKYSLAGGDNGYEQYFTSSDKLTNHGVISPGKIGGTIVEGDIGQLTIGQIDVHGSLTFTDESVYNLTISGIPTNSQKIGQWAEDSDAIWVTGTTIMRGKLRVFLTDDFVQNLKALPDDDPITYEIIRSGSFFESDKAKFTELEFGGNFSDVKISGVYVNPYDSTVAQITLFPNPHYFENKGNTRNTRSVGRAIDSATWEAPELAFSLLGAKDDPATMNDVLHQIATDVRANSIMSGVLNPSRVLFPRIGWGNGQMDSGERGRIDWRVNRERTIMNQFSQLRGQSPQPQPQQLRNGSVWFDYIGQSISSPSDGNSSGYSTYVNGGILGGEWNLTQHSALGLTLGYGNGATNSGRDKVRVNDYFMGLYLVATPYNQYEFKAYFGVGRQEYTMYHTIFNSTLKDSNTGQIIGIFDKYYGRTDGTTINMSYELTRPVKITERFILRPTIGVDTQHAWQGAFTEEVLSSTNNGLYALSFDSMYLNHNMVRLGLNSESIGPRGSLWLRGFYNLNFGGNSYPTSKVRFAKGGEKFDVRGANIGLDALNIGVGFHLWLNAEHSASLITDFNTDFFIGNSGASAFGLRLGIVHNF
ncbi:MAG: autotransporter outer membrane beta-barrel domain-containing protein [Planctomycetaceae bacterium]|jgi:hypothetical protein|nr:autotransporter outer membrane beta-barrel domain-containing protein [Planctomycetaceae bacterium]